MNPRRSDWQRLIEEQETSGQLFVFLNCRRTQLKVLHCLNAQNLQAISMDFR
ncbi:transposase [Acidithiobacillus sp. CV18-2]|uniref:Transposase n=1 Tax=Igneacidithiobacillus copahuensis TaxID=2724909 RepID=A0AAE2YS65_9PROT|nr:hypothetical protein [Igneacidithiobacillus copahuensis]MBU2755738.1 transposase [Acidithiobacillus sp. CV18-3]MBU2757081.1 transposase [Acidithiobacillus sp. BN09-2]MBU2778557.1 transposase [Acidithiobacillus sp. CV18-2]MBU2797671.1 transposase [Acidithiobacillus sp. VAN18-2]MBU2798171.1 transposase [Acidithiobacillus sp. VAN18-4]UTV82253.1 hypothetical protein MQE22_06460 [Acidithiobacillus sp. YTS05]